MSASVGAIASGRSSSFLFEEQVVDLSLRCFIDPSFHEPSTDSTTRLVLLAGCLPPSSHCRIIPLHSRDAQRYLNMKKLKFKIKLDGMEGSSVAALSAPFDVEEVFGTRARVPVRGTINGFPFRSSLMPMGGCHRMVVNRTIRDGAGVKAGDTVSVVMEGDKAERSVEVPPLLKKELTRSKAAAANWEKLSYTHQKEIALCLVNAKQEETRMRRLTKVMDILKNGKKWTG